MVTHVTSKLSLSSSSDNIRPRTMSFAETESFLRIGPALPVIPPSNSPTLNMTKTAISLTLADVCNKLAPLVDEQRLHKQRKHRHRSHSNCDTLCFMSSRKHSRSGGGGDSQSKKKRVANAKMVCLGIAHHPHLSPISCTNNRIGRRFNSPIPLIGHLLPQSQSPV